MADKPIAHVLMAKHTGELMEGYKITFFEKYDLSQDTMSMAGYRILLAQHDGWIVFRADVSHLAFFLNRESEKYFEDLGVL
jgi:hypothetical protein